MDILSTLKTEYSRTLILIVIPGGIAFYPFSEILFKYYTVQNRYFEYFLLTTLIIYLLASIFLGFIIQDLGAMLEEYYDKLYCNLNNKSKVGYLRTFQKYLFNTREETYIITHYYRSLLVRLKFELHSVFSIFILWIGLALRLITIEKITIDPKRTILFIILSIILIIYLNYESYRSVKTLHFYRRLINRKFNPSFKPSHQNTNQKSEL